MAAAAPVRHLLNLNNDDRPGNRCPICQEWEAPTWKGGVNYRQECCGVLICRECWLDWRGERIKVINDFEELCGRKAYAKFKKRWAKKLRARARGEKDKEEAKSTTKKKGGTGKEDEKKRALEKLLERHRTCPSCRAPLAATDEDQVAQLRPKAEQGESWAQRLLGERYQQGAGVRKDARQAERWFQAAMTDTSVMDGGPAAAYHLGNMYADGDGVSKDVEEAKKLWTMAHEAGHVKATYYLAILFRGGCGPAAGVPDLGKAFTLYRQAAEAGYAAAQHSLGLCYANGEGVEQDKEKAKVWYAKAAKQGYADAMINLAIVLHETEGTTSFPTQMVLTRAAAEKGDAEAQKSLPQWEQHILSKCASCGKPSADMAGAPLKCARCKAAAYCSAECQKQHWKRGGHKKACNERERYLPEKEEDEE